MYGQKKKVCIKQGNWEQLGEQSHNAIRSTFPLVDETKREKMQLRKVNRINGIEHGKLFNRLGLLRRPQKGNKEVALPGVFIKLNLSPLTVN